MKAFLSVVIILVQLNCLFAQSNTNFLKANKLYEKEKYSDAIILYEQILNEEKIHSEEIYYNLGNAYFKITDYPNAILNYERAKKLNPNDEDIQFNLSLANQKIEDRIDPIPQLFYVKWFQSARTLFDQDSWAILFIIILSLSVSLLSLFIYSTTSRNKKVGFYGSLVSFVLSLIVLAFAVSMHNWQENKREAIVFAGSVSVKSSPVESSTGLFVIHAGTKVKIIDALGAFIRIELADGTDGWILFSDVEEI